MSGPAAASHHAPVIYRMTLIVALVCLCATATARASGEYRVVEIEGLKIVLDSEWAPRSAPGYLPVRFDITNLAEARVIQIVGRGSRFFFCCFCLR